MAVPEQSALEELREEIAALGQLAVDDPAFAAHLALALAKIAKRLDYVYAELGLALAA